MMVRPSGVRSKASAVPSRARMVTLSIALRCADATEFGTPRHSSATHAPITAVTGARVVFFAVRVIWYVKNCHQGTLPHNGLRFCCQALRWPSPSWQSNVTGDGRSALGLVSSKRGLARTMEVLPAWSPSNLGHDAHVVAEVLLIQDLYARR